MARYLAKWGNLGSGEGEFDSPWGITLDREGYVYVVDHKNHRLQKFTPEGEYVTHFGSYGKGPGELNHPCDVAVDPDGDIYVCDWANNRVQLFAPRRQVPHQSPGGCAGVLQGCEGGGGVQSGRSEGSPQGLQPGARMALSHAPGTDLRRRKQ